MLPNKLLLSLCILSLTSLCTALYSFGVDPESQSLETNDISAVSLEIAVKYAVAPRKELYLYPNGIVSFDGPLPSQDVDLYEHPQDAIAVLYYPDANCTLSYRDTKDEAHLLANLTDIIRRAFSDASEFKALYAVFATWKCYGDDQVKSDKPNIFQLVLITDEISSYALMIYDQVEWSGANKKYAVVGTFASDSHRVELPPSGTDVLTELPKLSNFHQNGKFLFRISDTSFNEPRNNDDDSEENEDLDEGPYIESTENNDCPPDPYQDHCPEDCEVLTDERDCSMCICTTQESSERDNLPRKIETTDQPQQPVPEGMPEQAATVEDDDQAQDDDDDDTHHPVESHPPQPQQPTEQQEVTDSEQSYNDLDDVPIQAPDDNVQPEQKVESPTEAPWIPERKAGPGRHPYPPYQPPRVAVISPPSPPVQLPEPPIGQGAGVTTHEQPIYQMGIPLNCAAAKERGPACDAHAHCIDYHPGFCCECAQDYYGNGEECLRKDENVRLYGTLEGPVNGVQLRDKSLDIFADTKKGQAYFAMTDIPAYIGPPFLLVDEISTVIGWLFAKLDSPGAYNGFQLTGGIFNRTVNIHIGERHALMIKQFFTGRDGRGYFQVQMYLTGTIPHVDERSHIVYPPRDVEYRREGPGFIRSYSYYTIVVKEQGFERPIRVTVDQQIYYKECSFKEFDKEPILVAKVTRPHVDYNPDEKIVRYAAENKATNGFFDIGHPGDRYRYGFPQQPQGPYYPEQPQVSKYPQQSQLPHYPQQPQLPRQSQYPSYPQQTKISEQPFLHRQSTEDPCAPGRHQCIYPHMRCFAKDGKSTCECEDGYTSHVNATTTSLGWYCKDIDECYQIPNPCDVNADCHNTDGSYECVCKPGFTGNGRYCYKPGAGRGCRGNEDCHKWGECVTGENGQRQCRCRGWYVGDGITHCGPPETTTLRPDRIESTPVPHKGPHECGYYLCHKDADCVVSPSGTQTCRCREGFYGNGVSCEPREIISGTVPPGMQCTSHQACVKHANCVHHNDGHYRCVCVPPTVAQNGACVKRPETVSSPYVPCNIRNNCDRNAVCRRVGNSYRCICRPGFAGSGYTCTRKATPAPELQCDRLKNCGPNAVCQYNPQNRRYTCRCITGYTGDGYVCSPIPTQPPTYSPTLPPVTFCRDKSECHPNAHCVINAEYKEYVCECLNGFDGDGVRECRRIDECNPTKSRVCHRNARCEFDDDARAFKCRCVEGFKGDGITCLEAGVVECDRRPSMCHPEAQCIYSHEDRRYVCKCQPGWIGDGYNNCQMTQSRKCAQCSAHARCVIKSDGEYGCVCLPGYQGNGQVCAQYSSCLNDRSICDANAQCVLNEQGRYVCNCNYGYHGNGSICIPNSDKRDMLLIARGMSIIERGMSPDTVGKQLIVKPGQVVVGLAYDCKEERVYWTDIKGPVHSAFLNGSNVKNLLNLTSPEGIVVDWSSRNFYYVDAQQDKPEIGVASLDGRYRKTLAKEGFNQPRYLALDLKNRHLYYSDWHRPHPVIGRMNLDGTGNEPFIDTDLQLPNGLVVLQRRNELCWLDAGMHSLSCIGLHDRVRRIVYAPLEYPFGLTVHDSRQFYWTDWKDGRLHTVSIDGHGYMSFQITHGTTGKPYGLIAIPSTCEGEESPCSYNNGGCPYLCLPGPDGAKCVCPDEEGLEGC